MQDEFLEMHVFWPCWVVGCSAGGSHGLGETARHLFCGSLDLFIAGFCRFVGLSGLVFRFLFVSAGRFPASACRDVAFVVPAGFGRCFHYLCVGHARQRPSAPRCPACLPVLAVWRREQPVSFPDFFKGFPVASLSGNFHADGLCQPRCGGRC